MKKNALSPSDERQANSFEIRIYLFCLSILSLSLSLQSRTGTVIKSLESPGVLSEVSTSRMLQLNKDHWRTRQEQNRVQLSTGDHVDVDDNGNNDNDDDDNDDDDDISVR